MSTHRPNIVEDAHLEYLDELRESGETNMFGSAKYLRARFNTLGFNTLDRKDARTVIVYWMDSFEERHP